MTIYLQPEIVQIKQRELYSKSLKAWPFRGSFEQKRFHFLLF